MGRLNAYFAAAAAAAVLSALGVARASANDIQVVAVPSAFTPAKIVVHAGTETKLTFVHTEGVHAVQSRELGIPLTTLAPGKDVSIEFTPKKAGTFVLHCEVVCGDDHDNMALTIVVES